MVMVVILLLKKDIQEKLKTDIPKMLIEYMDILKNIPLFFLQYISGFGSCIGTKNEKYAFAHYDGKPIVYFNNIRYASHTNKTLSLKPKIYLWA